MKDKRAKKVQCLINDTSVKLKHWADQHGYVSDYIVKEFGNYLQQNPASKWFTPTTDELMNSFLNSMDLLA